LNRVDHVWKIRDRKQRMDIGKYSFVNRTIKNWNQLHAKALGSFPCKFKIVRNSVRKAIIMGLNERNRSVHARVKIGIYLCIALRHVMQ